MPNPPERGNLTFDPPIKPHTDQYVRAWELIAELGLGREIIFGFVGVGWIESLSFPTKNEAMIFKLRL